MKYASLIIFLSINEKSTYKKIFNEHLIFFTHVHLAFLIRYVYNKTYLNNSSLQEIM